MEKEKFLRPDLAENPHQPEFVLSRAHVKKLCELAVSDHEPSKESINDRGFVICAALLGADGRRPFFKKKLLHDSGCIQELHAIQALLEKFSLEDQVEAVLYFGTRNPQALKVSRLFSYSDRVISYLKGLIWDLNDYRASICLEEAKFTVACAIGRLKKLQKLLESEAVEESLETFFGKLRPDGTGDPQDNKWIDETAIVKPIDFDKPALPQGMQKLSSPAAEQARQKLLKLLGEQLLIFF